MAVPVLLRLPPAMKCLSVSGLLVVLVAASHASPAQLNTGGNATLPLKKLMRIVGGTAADIREFGHQVSWFYDGVHRCGGSIISPEWVITAAHCCVGLLPGLSEIIAGTSVISTRGRSKGQVVHLLDVHPHPRFDYRVYSHDIALLRVSPPFTFDGVVHAIPIIEPSGPPGVNDPVTVTGWGLLRENSAVQSPVLQKVKVQVIDMNTCKARYNEVFWPLPDTIMCAAAENKDACQGDSGGPLIYTHPEDNTDRLVGLVSSGKGCASRDFAGLYTDLRHPEMRAFITDVSGMRL